MAILDTGSAAAVGWPWRDGSIRRAMHDRLSRSWKRETKISWDYIAPGKPFAHDETFDTQEGIQS
jgi:hypothetical protein